MSGQVNYGRGVGAQGLPTAVEQERVIALLPVELRALARHVLLGGFRRGVPVGFHHAPGGVCPPGRRIDEVLERFPDGTYRARVSFLHPTRGWLRKDKPHSMFPDDWPSERVMSFGLDAYRARTDQWLVRWVNSKTRPPIRGRHSRGRQPTTFFPDLEDRRF